MEINISEVIEPARPTVLDWRVPFEGFTCRKEENCFMAQYVYLRGGGSDFRPFFSSDAEQQSLVRAVPPYRTPYGMEENFRQFRKYLGLRETMGNDFDLETSMACALGSLFRFAPMATKYQPDLFSIILPTLHDENPALVLTLYIRTGHAEWSGTESDEKTLRRYREAAQRIIECAVHVEDSMMGKNESSSMKNRPIVWMVVSDSPYVKTWIKENYGNDTESSRRTIVSTQSRGAHTRFNRNDPSTADFAEAFLDWYLIGESDVVVADYTAPSFGDTAAFRSARPYFKVSGKPGEQICKKVEPTLKWSTSDLLL
jgi:hypothetical protein